MEARYVLMGNPGYHTKAGMPNRRIWDLHQETKIRYQLSLGNQHGDRPLFKGPFSLTASFFLAAPTQKKTGGYFTLRPDLSDLVRFLELAAIGILFNDDAYIVSVNAQKYFHADPHTIFIIKEIDNDKKE